MITDKDIDRLLKAFATKPDFKRLEEKVDTLSNLDNKLDKIMNSLDGLTVKFDKHELEYAALKTSDNRQNSQLKHIAQKLDIRLPE